MMSLMKMKKTMINILTVALLATLIVIPTGTESNAAVTFNVSAVVNSSGGAYLRSGPAKTTKVVGLIDNGTALSVHREHFTKANSTAAGTRWYYVTAAGKKGYIRADLVKNLKHNGAKVIWATDDLNFRLTPGTGATLLGAYSKGEAFYTVMTATVAGSSATWYKVRNGNTFYYVIGSYITFTKPAGGNSQVTLTKKVNYGNGPVANVTQSAASQKVAADAVTWAIKIANDNTFHYGNGHHAHHNGCYFCGTQPSSKRKYVVAWEKTYCCNPFVHAAYAHGGKEQTMLKVCRNYGSYDWEYLKTHNKLFAKLGHPAKSSLKKGDVLCYDGHMAMYIGNGQLVEAGHEDNGKKFSSSWNSSISVSELTDRRYRGFTHVYRYIGKN